MSGVKRQIRHQPRLTFCALFFVLSWSLWIPMVIFVRPPPRRAIQRSITDRIRQPRKADGPICHEYWLP
jgi:hypothetical protein